MRRKTFRTRQVALAKVRQRLRMLEQLEERTNMAQYSFAGVTFEQNSTPDVQSALAVGTYSDAIVTHLPSGSSSVSGFPDAPTTGFDPALSLGVVHSPVTSGPRLLNLPSGNNGTTRRSGVELGWSNNRLLPNGPGNDFVVYESGTISGSGKSPEPFLVQVYNASTSAWSSWYYFAATSSAPYGGTGNEGAFATVFDLSNMGVGSGDYVSQIRLVNITDEDRLASASGEGVVIPEDNGANSEHLAIPGPEAPYSAFTPASNYDPDPVYLGVLHDLYLNLVVDSTSDIVDGDYTTGNLSLREAVELSNAVAGANEITFAPGLAGSTITLGSELAITDDLTITGLGANQLTISGNNASRIFNVDNPSEASTVSISGLTLTAGSALGGGAIRNVETLTLDSVEVTNSNGATGGGGGLVNAGTAVVTNSTFFNNRANEGGAILSGVSLTVVNSTFSANESEFSGSAISNLSGSTTIVNSTIVGNRADSDGSGSGAFAVYTETTPYEMRNTIVAGNLAGLGSTASDVAGAITGSNNLIGDASSAGGFVHGVDGNIVGNAGSGTLALSSILNTTLANNGGSTRTHALATGSLAIDAGDNAYATTNGQIGGTALITDQRGAGFDRIVNSLVDIGAFEAPVAVVTQADLFVTLEASGSGTVVAGETLTYTITVGNDGPSTADDVSFANTLPAGTTFVEVVDVSGATFDFTTPAVGATGAITGTLASLPATESASFQIVVRVGSSVAQSTLITNTVSVATATDDPTDSNDSAEVQTTVITSADVSISLSDSPDPVIAGEFLTYQVNVANLGPSDAQTVDWSTLLPAGTEFISLTPSNVVAQGFNLTTPSSGNQMVSASIATLPALSNGEFVLTILVERDVANATVLSTTAAVTTTTNDLDEDNNSETVATTVETEADLSISIFDSPATVVAGQNITYTITLENLGSSNAANVVISNVLPAGTTFVSLNHVSGPTYDSINTPAVGATGTFTAQIDNLDVGAETTMFELVVRVDSNVAEGATIENTVTVASATNDSTPANNSAEEETDVTTNADLSIAVTGSPDTTVLAGANLTYTITVSNNGPSDSVLVVLNDELPAETTFVSFAQIDGPAFTLIPIAVGTNGSVSAEIASFAANASATFHVVVLVGVGNADGAVLENIVSITADTDDGESDNNSAAVTTTVSNPPILDPAEFLIAFDPPTGRWFGSHLTNGTSQVLANFGANKGWRDGIVADFNGDGVSDLAARNSSGRWFVALAQPGQPVLYQAQAWNFSTNKAFEKVQVADVNKDGKADIIGYSRGAGSAWYVFRTNAGATNFNVQILKYAARNTWTDFVIADFTGDGRTDFAARVQATNPALSTWYVSTAGPAGVLSKGKVWGKWGGLPWKDVQAADYNGDGKADIVGRDPATGRWRIAQSNGAKFVSRDLGAWQRDALAKWKNVIVADLNGDGKDDIVGQNAAGYWFWIRQNGAQNVFANKIGRWLPTENYKSVFAADLSGDGKVELFGRRGTNGVWRIDRLNAANRLAAIPGAVNKPAWDKNVDWMFASLGEDENGNLF